LVFTPKYRRGPFTDEILTRCEEIMRAVCADFDTELVEFNGERDHVHLLVHYPPKVLERHRRTLARQVAAQFLNAVQRQWLRMVSVKDSHLASSALPLKVVGRPKSSALAARVSHSRRPPSLFPRTR
jgi:REP element-mobilizing transposase RayT